MLVIRLSRQGRRNHPTYRLVVAENSKATDGSFVEIVGNYNSVATDQPLKVEKERVEYWLSKGATPSNTVAKLLNKVGFDLPVEKKSKAPKKKAEEAKKAASGGGEDTTGADEVSAATEEAQTQPQEGDSVNNAPEIANEEPKPQEEASSVPEQPAVEAMPEEAVSVDEDKPDKLAE